MQLISNFVETRRKSRAREMVKMCRFPQRYGSS